MTYDFCLDAHDPTLDREWEFDNAYGDGAFIAEARSYEPSLDTAEGEKLLLGVSQYA